MALPLGAHAEPSFLILLLWFPYKYSCCRALRRTRHHCRLCGGIFCHVCTATYLLLPPKFQQSRPQRCCKQCASLLEPLQPLLAGVCVCALVLMLVILLVAC